MASVIDDPAAIDRGVESIMDPPFPGVDAGASPDALAPLLRRGNAAVLVRRDGEIHGILTRHDMVRHLTGR
jgi:cystathionine beta-synthase